MNDPTDGAGPAADATDPPAPDAVLRRAPFSDNPTVGARGQRTRQAILDAALKVFGDIGYQRASIDKIAKAAGCSRVSFYQYFAGKEDVFRRLAGHVDRELAVSNERLAPITPNADGWASIRAWAGRYADIYDRYEPVFNTFPAAAESDLGLSEDAARLASRYGVGFRARVTGSDLRDRILDPVLELLRESMTGTLGDRSTFHHVEPALFPLGEILDAYADVVHRTLFGRIDGVNVHGSRARRAVPPLPFTSVMEATISTMGNGNGNGDGRDGPTRTALLDAGRQVLVTRGYHGTRIDDIADAAGVAHGAFYRYFKNKEQLAQVLAAEAVQGVSTTFVEIPSADADPSRRTALRRWLRSYNRAQSDETAIIRVWADAALQDDALRGDSAAMLDWGRRRMARFLADRDFGDPDLDGIVLLAMVDAFGVVERPNDMVEAAATIIERGFLGAEAPLAP